MCGIIGCIMQRDCTQTLYQTLSLLEYRGYDSVGVALLNAENKIQVHKNVGGVENLQLEYLTGNLGIGHTRWATHGKVSVENAHPHCSENFALVHNGIIENYLVLKAEYLQDVPFQSTTDSEVLVHLIEKFYQDLLLQKQQKSEQDNIRQEQNLFVRAVQLALQKVQGSYAITVLSSAFPNQLVASRNKCPLLVAKGKNQEVLLCSDIQAISDKIVTFATVQERELVHIQADDIHFYRSCGKKVERKFHKIVYNTTQVQKSNTSFMEREILEIPVALQSCLKALKVLDLQKLANLLQEAEAMHIVACGTSYHAGLVYQSLMQRYSNIPVQVHLASEIYATQKNIHSGDLVIALSQSGETADSLEAIKLLKRNGCKILSITNTPYSSLSVLSHFTIWMQAGQEIAVAATKTYVCQLLTLYFLAAKFLELKGENLPKFLQQLEGLPNIVKKVYANFDQIHKLAQELKRQQAMAVIGRELDLPTAKEAALKIKEITYIFAEAYAAGELKHGSLALIDKDFCVLAVATQRKLFHKIENALLEIQSRQGKTILCTPYTSQVADFTIQLPKVDEGFMPIVSVIPLQYLACKLSEAKGIHPDKPKNLAKSVTVE